MSQNLQKKLQKITLVEDWYEARVGTASRLALLFNSAIGSSNVFSSIYVSIRNNPQNASQEASETFTYYNVGFTDTDIAAYFNSRYGANYFCYNYNDSLDVAAIRDKLAAIYNANKYKYMKLIEIVGYKYNPLYNVDGIELYGNAESLGDSSSTRKPSGKIKTTTGTEENNVIKDTTSTNYVNPYDETSTATRIESQNKQSPVTSIQEFTDNYQEESELQHKPAMNYKYDSESGKWVEDQLFVVAASDNAFGVEYKGAERYYAEKRIRQGNIGVTKSQELVTAQRDVVKFNILEEFFRDIEHDLIVGIY